MGFGDWNSSYELSSDEVHSPGSKWCAYNLGTRHKAQMNRQLGGNIVQGEVPSFKTLSPGEIASVSLNYKLWLSRGHFGFLVSRDQQARRGDTIL